ncbi:MAG TPA: GNAT family N-acetyltransferase [Dehalococcoidia bacterium]|nr:GNAT family N-acetyltransferase [Dehalococcoidia bacterium]
MSGYMIREARPEDFDPIITLWGQIDRHTALPDRREYLETFHAFSPDLLLVAESGGRLVATVIGGWDGWRANIARLSTHPGVRRKGVAMALVREIERRLLAKGARRIYALVDKRSPPARPFWEAAGYVVNENILQYSRNVGDAEDAGGGG